MLVALSTMLAIGITYAGGPGGLLNRDRNQLRSERSTFAVVATHELARGQRIFPDMVRTSSISATAMPPHAFRTPSSVWFFTTVVPIHEGEIITTDLLRADDCSFCPLPLDYVAVTLPFDSRSGVRSLAAGDYVDVIATVDTAALSSPDPHSVTRTAFASVAVIAMNPPPTVQVSPRSLTLFMPLCDAQYVDWLLVNASLRYRLALADYAAEIAPAGAWCASTPGPIGAAQVNARWGFDGAGTSRLGY